MPKYRREVLKLYTPQNDIVHDVNLHGNDVRVKVTTPVVMYEVKAKLGQQCEQVFLDGRMVKVGLHPRGQRSCRGHIFDMNVVSLREEQPIPTQLAWHCYFF
jgi:hypothetical protein